MTYEKLKKLIEKYLIPEDVHLVSDSRWECDPTEMDGVYYDIGKNEIVFTQDFDRTDYATKGLRELRLNVLKYEIGQRVSTPMDGECFVKRIEVNEDGSIIYTFADLETKEPKATFLEEH